MEQVAPEPERNEEEAALSNMSAEELDRRLQLIAQTGTRAQAIRIAAHPELSDAALEALCTHREWQVRVAVTGNPMLTVSALELLANDADVRVRRALVNNPLLPAHWIEHLASDEDMEIRTSVLNRSDVTPAAAQIAILLNKNAEGHESMAKQATKSSRVQNRDPFKWQRRMNIGDGMPERQVSIEDEFERIMRMWAKTLDKGRMNRPLWDEVIVNDLFAEEVPPENLLRDPLKDDES